MTAKQKEELQEQLEMFPEDKKEIETFESSLHRAPKGFTTKTYTEFARTTDLYPEDARFVCHILGMVSESSEVASKLKKFMRGDDPEGKETMEGIVHEVGDVLWYIVRFLDERDVSLEDCMYNNFKKVESRKKRGVLRGDGDYR